MPLSHFLNTCIEGILNSKLNFTDKKRRAICASLQKQKGDHTRHPYILFIPLCQIIRGQHEKFLITILLPGHKDILQHTQFTR
jgi:hypothetical protein